MEGIVGRRTLNVIRKEVVVGTVGYWVNISPSDPSTKTLNVGDYDAYNIIDESQMQKISRKSASPTCGIRLGTSQDLAGMESC